MDAPFGFSHLESDLASSMDHDFNLLFTRT